MPLHTGATLSEIDDRVKDLLLISDNAAAHWDATARLRYINAAQIWVQWTVLSGYGERKTKDFLFTMPSGGVVYEVALPSDCLVEVKLYKKNPDKAGESAWEAVRLIRPKNEDGWSNPGNEEIWVANGRTLRSKGLSAAVGDYRLAYVERVNDLANDDDICGLDPDFHEAVWTRAAERCAIATSDSELADRLKAELSEWKDSIRQRETLIESMRAGDITARPAEDFHEGSLFWLMERLRSKFIASVPGDMLSRDRLRLCLNEAQEVIALRVKQVFESSLEKYHYFTLDGTSAEVALPKDFKSEVILEQQTVGSTGEFGWFKVNFIRPSDREFHIYSGVQAAVVPTSGGSGAAMIIGGNIRIVAGDAPSATYRLLYIPRIKPLMSDDDECALDGDYHQAVVLEAARSLAVAFNQLELAGVFAGELSKWEGMIVQDARTRSFSVPSHIKDDMGWGSDGDGSAYPFGW